jgi:hypothetical protein
MSLITMHVVKAVPGGASLHGDFVIDSPVTGEAEILASLTDRDKGEIACRFGFGSIHRSKCRQTSSFNSTVSRRRE